MRNLSRHMLSRMLLPLLGALAFVPLAHAFGTGAQGCSGDCAACHSVKKEEAVAIMKALDPGIAVEAVGPSPVRGLYQVTVKKGEEAGILYLDFSKKYLIAGRVIDTAYRKDITEEGLAEMRRIDPTRIPLDNALVLGNQNGARKLYVFTDPDCPFCANLHHELTGLVKSDPQLAVYLFLLPLEIHPDAAWKTDAILCAAKEKMTAGVQLLEASFEGKPLSKSECGTSYAGEGKKLGRELGIAITPTMVFSDGRVVTGAKKGEEIKKLLDEAEEHRAAAAPQQR